MANILIILSILGLLKTLLMVSLSKRKVYHLLFVLSCILFIWFSYPYAIEMNKLQVEEMLYEKNSILNIALFVILDLFLTGYFFWVMLLKWNGKPVKRYMRVPAYIPSILGYASLFYIQLNLYYFNTGISFLTTTIVYSVGIAIVFLLLIFLIRKFLPEIEFRLELITILSFLLFTLVVCCTIFHPSAMIYHSQSEVNFKELLFAIAVLGVLFMAGYCKPIISKIIQLKKKK